jgi:hypothetical protein
MSPTRHVHPGGLLLKADIGSSKLCTQRSPRGSCANCRSGPKRQRQQAMELARWKRCAALAKLRRVETQATSVWSITPWGDCPFDRFRTSCTRLLHLLWARRLRGAHSTRPPGLRGLQLWIFRPKAAAGRACERVPAAVPHGQQAWHPVGVERSGMAHEQSTLCLPLRMRRPASQAGGRPLKRPDLLVDLGPHGMATTRRASACNLRR